MTHKEYIVKIINSHIQNWEKNSFMLYAPLFVVSIGNIVLWTLFVGGVAIMFFENFWSGLYISCMSILAITIVVYAFIVFTKPPNVSDKTREQREKLKNV